MGKLVKKKLVKNKKPKRPNIKEGDIVTVSNIDLTRKRHGASEEMVNMIGSEYEVKDAGTRNDYHSYVVLGNTTETWIFATADVDLVTAAEDIVSLAMPVEKIMFDPCELIVAA